MKNLLIKIGLNFGLVVIVIAASVLIILVHTAKMLGIMKGKKHLLHSSRQHKPKDSVST